MPVYIGDPVTWGRDRDGDKITTHAECPSPARQAAFYHEQRRPRRWPSKPEMRTVEPLRRKVVSITNPTRGVYDLQLGPCGHVAHADGEAAERIDEMRANGQQLAEVVCAECTAGVLDHWRTDHEERMQRWQEDEDAYAVWLAKSNELYAVIEAEEGEDE
jgi:hypothetical protein